MGKKSGPAAPDPKATAAAQTGTNVSTAVANAVLQNGSVQTADGTRTTTFDGGTYEWTDPSTGSKYSIPLSRTVETLSPAQQAIKDQQDAASLNLSTLAKNQSAALDPYLSDRFKYDTSQHEAWAGNLYDKLNSSNNAANEEAVRTRLANQGIKMGSAAYDREMSNYAQGRDNARNQFLLDSQQQGFSQAQAQRNQPINEITALMSGGQVSQPVFNAARTSTIPTTDYAGIVQQDFQNRQQGWANKQASLGGLFSGIGSILALSEPSAKKDKTKLPLKAANGIQMWTYRYKGEPKSSPKHVGVMADETERKMPQAVVRGTDGRRRVNMGIVMGR